MYQIYQVLPDENIEIIASKFNTNASDLITINGLSVPTNLTPGSYIVVPKTNDNYFQTYIVKKGDNLYSIAERQGTSVSTIELLNGLKKGEYIYPGQQLLIPNSNVTIYVTEEETLSEIANKLGVSIEDLINQNKQLYLSPEQIVVYKK